MDIIENNLSTLKEHFVTYIDILGFTNMVENDFLKNPKNPSYITKLYTIHQFTKSMIDQESEDIDFIQFSDSVVITMKFDRLKFTYFIKLISKFQYDLLREGILCRGGIAYGKHFFENNFMYSHGLIEAYKVETEVAINPKIVISPDLFELLYPSREIESGFPILRDEDGTIFVDYLANYQINDKNIITSIVNGNESTDPKIISKYRWLSRYTNFKGITQNKMDFFY